MRWSAEECISDHPSEHLSNNTINNKAYLKHVIYISPTLVIRYTWHLTLYLAIPRIVGKALRANASHRWRWWAQLLGTGQQASQAWCIIRLPAHALRQELLALALDAGTAHWKCPRYWMLKCKAQRRYPLGNDRQKITMYEYSVSGCPRPSRLVHMMCFICC